MPHFRILVGLWLLATCCCLGSASTTLADTPKRATADVNSIKKFMEEGQAFFVVGQYERAAEIFDKGYARHPYSAFLFNAGVALEKANRLADAVEHFKRYLEVDPKAPDAPDVAKRIAKIEQALADQKGKAGTTKIPKKPSSDSNSADSATKSLVIIDTEPPGATLRVFRRIRGESSFVADDDNPDWQEVLLTKATANASLDVGQYHVRVDGLDDYKRGDTSFEVLPGHVLQVKVSLSQKDFMGHLRITSNVGSALVFLDDPTQKKQPWGRAPHGELVPPGEHSVRVVATGYQPVTRAVTLSRGQHQELQIDLQRLDVGGLRLTCNARPASVFLDGKEVGSYSKPARPLELMNLRNGTHQLRVIAEGRKPLDAEIQIPKGQLLPVHAQLVVFPPRGAAYTQGIIGGVLLGGGIYFGLESNRLYSEMKSDRSSGTLASDDPRELRGKIYSIGADVAFLGSAVLGGLSVYNFVRDPLPPSRLAVRSPIEFDAPSLAPSSAKEPTSSLGLSRQMAQTFDLTPSRAIDATSRVTP